MKDQLIKLHEKFVDKGMPHSNINIVFLLKHASRIHDRNIGYVLLDMQTWLREEHGINVHATVCVDNSSKDAAYKYRWLIISLGSVINSELSKDYNEAWLSGLQEAIKLID